MQRPGQEGPSLIRSSQATAGLLVLVVAWCLITYSKLVPDFILASPSEVLRSLLDNLHKEQFWRDLSASIWRIGCGFTVSLIASLLFAYLAILSPSFSRLVIPPISFVRYLPVPALLPFLIVWLGIGELQKVAVVFVGVFFQLVLMVIDDLRAVPDDVQDVARSLGATRQQVIATVVFPSALPALYDSARVTLAWAWGWVMLAEVVGADSGLGYMLVRSQRFLLTADMLLALLIVGLLGLVMDLVTGGLRPWLFRWQ